MQADPNPTTPATPDSYRTPPAPIPEILGTRPTPVLALSPDRNTIALLGRNNLPPIAELAEPELRLAGVRINPRTNGPSRETFFNGITFGTLHGGERRAVGLPDGVQISDPSWSPGGTQLAFVNTTSEGLELWIADAASATAFRVLGPELNGALSAPFEWCPDGQSLLVTRVPPGRGPAPAAPAVPTGPVVEESRGKAMPSRTYQDLLESPHDEELFEHYFTAQLARVPAGGGAPVPLGEPGILTDFRAAPGGEYLLVSRIHRPYSYRIPYFRFPREVDVLDAQGDLVRRIADLPLAEDVPIAFDAVPRGPRRFQWRADAPATLLWVEALDEGDPRNPTEERDRVFLLSAPFAGEPTTLITLADRYAGTTWGRGDFAMVHSRWWERRWTQSYAVRPENPDAEPRLLFDRSYEDRYNDPGSPILTRNAAGERVILFSEDADHLFLASEGASPRGDYPLLRRMEIHTGEIETLWQSEDPYYEPVAAVIGPAGERIITRRESPEDPPNYYVRNLSTGALTAITDFPDPAPQLAGIQRRLITYPRADGVTLSATLFTPPGYDAERDGPLPLLLWAYPREFRDPEAAGQIQDSPNRFSRPGGASHLFLLTQGYAILDGPAMPIIGEGEAEPNDTYVDQLVASAEAAVDAVVEMGVADRERVGVGGHSYGAFMTANLLAHTQLFRAGIARSGAYNRTLTPFGFQQEQRTYWEAPETYARMSPFTYVDRIRAPILLVHGAEDNNTGTYPLQSERFFHALKGHGATVRYVVLPHESHGYRARESVLHTLAEMVDWMERYVKGAKVREAEGAA